MLQKIRQVFVKTTDNSEKIRIFAANLNNNN